jgi:hypothetical protein
MRVFVEKILFTTFGKLPLSWKAGAFRASVFLPGLIDRQTRMLLKILELRAALDKGKGAAFVSF